MKYCFGIDLGGTTVKCGLFTQEGELLEKWEIPTNKENKGEKIPQDIADTILHKMDEKKLNKADVLGVGMGIPGPVNAKGVVLGCANLGWGEFNVAEKMSVPCVLLNFFFSIAFSFKKMLPGRFPEGLPDNRILS